MRNIPNKTDNTSVLPAEDFNSINDELRTIILKGSEIIGGPNDQISKAISNHVGTADYYNEQAGTPDAINLSTSNATLQPTLYFDGLRVRFIGSVANSGDPSGVTVTVGTLGLQTIKQFDGSPLTAGSIVPNEMTELLFVGALDYFIIASTSNTRMITSDTTLIVNGGPNFLTLHDAYESIRDQYILDNVVVTIQIEGDITETETTIIAHSEGNNIRIIGELSITTDILSVNSVSGGAGAFSVEYEVTPGSLAGILVGDYVIIHDTVSAGPDILKEYGRKHEGIWKVTDAGAGSEFTVTNKFGFAMSDALKTSDMSTAKVTLLQARLNYEAGAILRIKNTSLNAFSDIAIVEVGGGSEPLFQMENAAIDLDGQPLGVVSETQGAMILRNSKITSKSAPANLAAISDVNESFIGVFSSMTGIDSFIVNASGGFNSVRLDTSYLQADNIISCGNANASPFTEAGPVAFNLKISSTIDAKSLVALTNVNIGIGIFGGSELITENLITSDNGIGIAIFNGSAGIIINSVEITDNDRTGTGKIGLDLGRNSMCAAGSLTSTHTVMTGNTTVDASVGANSHLRAATNLTLPDPNAIIGKANADLLSSVAAVDVTITTPTPTNGSIFV